MIHRKLFLLVILGAIIASMGLFVSCSHGNTDSVSELSSKNTTSTPSIALTPTQDETKTNITLTPTQEATETNINGNATGSIQESISQNTTPTTTPQSDPRLEFTEANISQYHLTVDGLVNSPLTLTYETLLQYSSVSENLTMICPGVYSEDGIWTGVLMSVILAEAEPKTEASSVTFYSLDGYEQQLPLSEVLQDGVFLAYQYNGKVLPQEQGYPLRLVVKEQDGYTWVRWLNKIEVS